VSRIVKADVPRSWFAYSDRIGPPVGSRIGVEGRWGRILSVTENGDMIDVEVEIDDDAPDDPLTRPDTLTGVPGADQLAIDGDDPVP
jgi:hypothetical protein